MCEIVLGRRDAEWLSYWARRDGAFRGGSCDSLLRIKDLLQQAMVLPDEKVDPDVVTLGSILEAEDSGDPERRIVWLVAPGYESELLEKVSVTSALGLSLLGRRVGRVVTVQDDTGHRVCIRRLLYQHRRAR